METKEMLRAFVIDNNDYVSKKSISLFKKMPFVNGVNHIDLTHSLKINNVKEGRVNYSLIDTPHNTYNSEVNVSPFEGIRLKIYKRGTSQIIKNELLLDGKTIKRQTTFKQIIGSFSFDEPVDIQVDVQLDSGYTRALLDKIERDKIEEFTRCVMHSCGGGAPPPPATIYTSLFEYMDVSVEYNNLSSNIKNFYNFKSKKNEFKEGAKIYSFSDEFEIENDLKYSRIMFGLNGNFCADISHYNPEWNPDDIPLSSEVERPNNFPCQRSHIIGDLKQNTQEIIFDNSKGELLEETYDSLVVTENNIASSQKYFEIDIRNLINGTSDVYSQKIFYLEEDEGVEFINLNIKVRKDEKKIYVISEFLARVESVDEFDNDRIRFKSDLNIGCLFIV